MSRGQRAAEWIERYCVVPGGPSKGERVRLTRTQYEEVLRLYDAPGRPREAVTGPLAGYLALLHVCGPEAVAEQDARPRLATDLWTVWGAVGPSLRPVLRREGETIRCPELGTAYPA